MFETNTGGGDEIAHFVQLITKAAATKVYFLKDIHFGWGNPVEYASALF